MVDFRLFQMNQSGLDNKKHDEAISLIRLISTLSIIACHVFQFWSNDLCAWFNVGVQLFFIISGYLYGLKDNIQTVFFLKKTFKKVLVPYWLFLTFAICYLTSFTEWESALNIKSVGLAYLGAGTIRGMRHLWFVSYILFCYLLVPYLHALVSYCRGKSLKYAVVRYLFVFVLINVLGFSFSSFFLPDRISAFVLAFFIPDIQKRLSVKANKSFALTCFAIGLFAWCARYHFRYNYSGSYVQIAGLFDRYSMILAAFSFFFVIKLLYTKKRWSHFYMISDKLSYPVYLVHGLFIFGPVSMLTMTSSVAFNLLLLMCVVLLLAITLELLSNKIIYYKPCF